MLKKINGDITALPFHVDAIVNSAHPTLLSGGGVCGAIHDKAGRGLENECDYLMVNLDRTKMPEAEPVVTTAHKLNAECVIHVVAKNLHGTPPDASDETVLRQCYSRTLELAQQLGCESVAFPLLGAGIYGWPKDLAERIATEELAKSDLETFLILFN